MQFVEYLPGDREKTRDIPEEEYARLGFRGDMTLEEAKARKDQLNDLAHVRQVEKRRSSISKRIEREERVLNAFLPAQEVEEFENSVIYAVGVDPKKRTIWKAARQVLRDLKIQPREWNYHQKRFYGYFIRQRWSYSYCQKILIALNQWGKFEAMRHGFYFAEIEFPRGDDLHRITDAYFEKSPTGRTSAPLTPEQLEEIASEIKPEWYNWFYLSVWFGLRPSEVDQLQKQSGRRTWWIEDAETAAGESVTALWLYQKKLVNLPPEKRVKVIPVILDQQRKGLEILRSGNFLRPSHSRHIQKHFGEQVYLYGGRKGFAALMRRYGQDQRDYSRWMGHSSIERTEISYEDRHLVGFKPIQDSPGPGLRRSRTPRPGQAPGSRRRA